MLATAVWIASAVAFTIAAQVIVACLPRYCLPVCACYRPPSTVTCLHYCRLSYRRLPSLPPLELLVTAYNADVREAIVYRLQSLQACDAGLGFGG